MTPPDLEHPHPDQELNEAQPGTVTPAGAFTPLATQPVTPSGVIGVPASGTAGTTRTYQAKIIASNTMVLNGSLGLSEEAKSRQETSRVKHVVQQAGSDLQILYAYSDPVLGSTPIGPFNIKVGLEYNGTIYPVTFNGKQTASLEPPMGGVLSDPVGLTVKQGDILYVRTFVSVPFGPAIKTTALIKIGDKTFILKSNPKITSGVVCVGTTAATAELVTIEKIEGAGPFTCTLLEGTSFTKEHAAEVLVGQPLPYTGRGYTDMEEGTSGNDVSYGGAIVGGNKQSTTVKPGPIAAGSIYVPMAAVIPEPEAVINKGGGTQETIKILGWTQNTAATEFRAWLEKPLEHEHAEGEAIESVQGAHTVYGPAYIVAQRVPEPRQKSVIIGGDSISYGIGYQLRLVGVSYATLALEGKKIPYDNLSQPSETQKGWLTYAVSLLRRGILNAGDWYLDELGVNDFNESKTTAEVIKLLEEKAAIIHGHGLKICACTIVPHTHSTDYFATLVNQEIVTPHDNERIAYNEQLVGTLLSTGVVDAVFDLAKQVESSPGSGKWTPGSPPITWDGLHPNAIGAKQIAVALEAQATMFS